jgi:Superinfection immunity protein/zinc-ribbon domain
MGRIGLPELLVLVVIAGGIALYFLPTIVAARRQKKNLASIALVNILLGWSFIGWVVALVWAMATDAVDVPATVVVQQQPGITSSQPARLCRHCGKYNRPDDRFCASCGQALAESAR